MARNKRNKEWMRPESIGFNNYGNEHAGGRWLFWQWVSLLQLIECAGTMEFSIANARLCLLFMYRRWLVESTYLKIKLSFLSIRPNKPPNHCFTEIVTLWLFGWIERWHAWLAAQEVVFLFVCFGWLDEPYAFNTWKSHGISFVSESLAWQGTCEFISVGLTCNRCHASRLRIRHSR